MISAAPSATDPNEWFSAAVRRSPQALFLREPSSGRQLTYAATDAAVGRMAGALRQLRVDAGDRVTVQVEKSVEAVLLYLACLRLGAIFMPLNTAYTPTELDYFVGDSQPALLVVDPERLEAASTIASAQRILHVQTLGPNGDGTLSELAATAPPAHDASRWPTDTVAALIYTSGTTGRSKGAMLTRGNLASNAATLASLWEFTSADVLLHALPIFHVHGLFVAINTVLAAGASMLYLAKFDAQEAVRLLPQATVFMGVPTHYTRLLQQPALTAETCSRTRLFISGSAPLLPETFREFESRTGQRVLERYGMTETLMNTSNPYVGERRPGTVGPPLPGVDLRIAGDPGVIEVRGPNVFKGYWRAPEKTAAEFRDEGFFSTGDLGRIDERGYVQILGRAKDLIITGGLNVYPIEIEEAIDALPGVAESAVIGLPHADFGEAVTAVIVRKAGSAVDERDVLNALAGRLAKFKLPKRVLFVDALPRNAMGKVQKQLLRATVGN
jgi:malonyl-CoA/methylmalonyl-CoA synthetase